ncbi:M20 aminoacylase family protein [Quisquiliibacterium transsilvanicum]|uniref:Hippurate hydrolase n=2 Tax=Quisquiliibacterium transsilvanicum TaxID=1549638 RepID=A0A7W8M997_9BURK|nr:hippurate hydrolase [Quisquiliibacterium transsilvanicum]
MNAPMTAAERIAALHPEMTEWRRDLHAHPELGFEETRTADFVARQLEAFGFDEVHRGVGRTGVVGVLRSGASPRTVGLRADMDALPIEEANTFEHRSRNARRMHACGHDGHTAMLLGAARYLAETRQFDGAAHFVFQPAEEGRGGAKAMIADGLFRRFPCDSIFGMHNRPHLAVGGFAVRAGPMMAGGAFFDIDIVGVGAHGARPEAGVDPVMVAVQIASTLQTIVSRNVPPVETAVLSITQIHAGDAYNVIPQTARLSGTVRAFSGAVMQLIENNLRRIAESVAQGMGAKASVDFRLEFAPLVNDAAQAEFAAAVCTELVGAGNVERNPAPIMGSEDFSFMLEQVPGCFINIGNGDTPGGCELHNPHYDFNDAALPLGAAFFARVVERKLGAG